MAVKYPDHLKIFTNGSVSNSGSVCGVATENGILLRFSLFWQFSMLSTELYAIDLTVQNIITLQHSYLIYTDSLYALTTLLNFNSKLNNI